MSRTDYGRQIQYRKFINLLAFELSGDYGAELEDAFKEMVMEKKYDTLTEDEIHKMLEAGASREFIMLAQYDDGERNSVRENAESFLEHGSEHFGDFGNNMWDGDLYHAMSRADGRNTRLLREVFGLEYINAVSRPRSGYKINENKRVVYR